MISEDFRDAGYSPRMYNFLHLFGGAGNRESWAETRIWNVSSSETVQKQMKDPLLVRAVFGQSLFLR